MTLLYVTVTQTYIISGPSGPQPGLRHIRCSRSGGRRAEARFAAQAARRGIRIRQRLSTIVIGRVHMSGLLRFAAALAIAVATVTPASAQEPVPAGHVKTVAGTATIVR